MKTIASVAPNAYAFAQRMQSLEVNIIYILLFHSYARLVRSVSMLVQQIALALKRHIIR